MPWPWPWRACLRGWAPRSASSCWSQQAPERNPDLNLDIGQTVTVDGWEDNGQTRINYRGTIWQAELLSGYPRRIGTHRIHAIAGSRLVLIPVELARATGSAPAPVAVG